MAALGKSVLITGCSAGGLGAGLAEVFREKGYHVFATLRNPSKLPSTLSKAANVTTLTLDVLSSDSIADAVSSVAKKTGGRLDILVNNSGKNFIMPALDTSIEEARKIFDVNFWAPMAMLQAFAPLLIQARGCVVNQSSAAGYVPMPFGSVYNGSKAALTMASEIWGRELQPLGIRTITLITNPVKSRGFDNIDKPKIPETSHYYVIRDYLDRLTDGRLQNGAPDARAYAIQVVGEIEKGTSGEVWVGKDAAMGRWARSWLPQFVFDMILEGVFKVNRELAKVAEVKNAGK